jgi:hypothetical protein
MGHMCSLLATVALAEYADCVLPIENQALLDILRSPLSPSCQIQLNSQHGQGKGFI